MIPGVVSMLRNSDGDWVVYDNMVEYPTPDTVTQGLQEAINLAYTNDVDLTVIGGGTSAVIQCNAGITWPPIRHRTIRIQSCTLNIVPESDVNSLTNGMTFDSCIMADWFMSGQIVYWGKGRAVLFAPTTPAMPENEISCAVSTFKFGAIACMTKDGFGVFFDGPMDRNNFHFMEINGKNDSSGDRSYHGIEISKAFVGNRLEFRNIHGFKGIGLRVGVAPTSAIYGNTFVGTIAPGPSGSSSVGVQIFGNSNFFNLAIINNEMGGRLVPWGMETICWTTGLTTIDDHAGVRFRY